MGFKNWIFKKKIELESEGWSKWKSAYKKQNNFFMQKIGYYIFFFSYFNTLTNYLVKKDGKLRYF